MKHRDTCRCKECSAKRFADLVTARPKIVRCEACEGAGDNRYWNGHYYKIIKCKACNGTGEIYV